MLVSKLGFVEKHPNKVTGSGLAYRDFARRHHDMEMIAHHRPGRMQQAKMLPSAQMRASSQGFNVRSFCRDIHRLRTANTDARSG